MKRLLSILIILFLFYPVVGEVFSVEEYSVPRNVSPDDAYISRWEPALVIKLLSWRMVMAVHTRKWMFAERSLTRISYRSLGRVMVR